MAERKFEKGDKVRCVADSFGLVIGHEYAVLDMGDGCLKVAAQHAESWHFDSKFELLEPAQAERQEWVPKVGDRVRVKSKPEAWGGKGAPVGYEDVITLIRDSEDPKTPGKQEACFSWMSGSRYYMALEHLEPAPAAQPVEAKEDSRSSIEPVRGSDDPTPGQWVLCHREGHYMRMFRSSIEPVRGSDDTNRVAPSGGDSGLPSGTADPYALHRKRLPFSEASIGLATRQKQRGARERLERNLASERADLDRPVGARFPHEGRQCRIYRRNER